MAEITGLQDWELLHSPDAAAPTPSLSDSSTLSSPAAVDDGGAIKHDYFSLNPHNHQPPSEADTDDAGIDSDNPSWLDPDSDTRYQRGQLNFARSDSDSILSDESEKGEVESMAEVGLSPIDPGEEEVEESGLRVSGDGVGGEKKGVAWWKMPFEVLKFCVLRVRPLWPISVAAAFVAIAMLGRKLYRMKQRVRSVPMRIAMDDKKVSQFMVRAARLNSAFSAVRRVPLVRPALPAGGGVAPWSLVS